MQAPALTVNQHLCTQIRAAASRRPRISLAYGVKFTRQCQDAPSKTLGSSGPPARKDVMRRRRKACADRGRSCSSAGPTSAARWQAVPDHDRRCRPPAERRSPARSIPRKRGTTGCCEVSRRAASPDRHARGWLPDSHSGCAARGSCRASRTIGLLNRNGFPRPCAISSKRRALHRAWTEAV